MAIIIFGGQKGGTGKSTLAFNIGAERAGQGRRVLLVDTDEQMTMVKWAARRKQAKIEPSISCISLFGETVSDEILDQSSHYDDIIVDCHGGMTPELVSALTVADKLFTPTKTGQADLDTFAQVDKLIPKVRAINRKLQAFVIINQALPGTRSGRAKNALAHLENFTILDHPIGSRVTFEDTAADGLGVTEYSRRDPKAVSELLLLSEEVWA